MRYLLPGGKGRVVTSRRRADELRRLGIIPAYTCCGAWLEAPTALREAFSSNILLFYAAFVPHEQHVPVTKHTRTMIWMSVGDLVVHRAGSLEYGLKE